MFKKAFNPAPNESESVPSVIAASNPQTISPQIFNPSAANNYLTIGPVTQASGVIRLQGTSIWKVI